MESKIIERVRALLSLAKSDNENEALAAAKQAMRLMEKHRISEAEVSVAQKEHGETPILNDVVFTSEKVKIAWKIRLANFISVNNGCKSYTETSNFPTRHRQVVIGSRADMDAVNVMFQWISVTGERLAHALVRQRSGDETSAKWRKDFLYGFADGVGEQLREAKKETHAEAEKKAISESNSSVGAALVHLKNHEERVLATYKAVPGLRSQSLGPRHISSGYDVGREKGKSLHLGKSLVE